MKKNQMINFNRFYEDCNNYNINKYKLIIIVCFYD